MARSKRGRGSRGFGDWETNPSIWGSGFQTLTQAAASASGSNTLDVLLVPPTAAVAAGGVPVGAAILSDVEADLDILNPFTTNVTNQWQIYAAFYLADFSDTTGAFAFQLPGSSASACRDNYLPGGQIMARGLQFPTPGVGNPSTIQSLHHHFRIPSVTVRQGYGLRFSITGNTQVAALAAQGFSFTFSCRYRIRRVA